MDRAERNQRKHKGVVGEQRALRFSALCRICSKWLRVGQQAQYLSAGWCHATVEECAAAQPSIHGLAWATDEERDSQLFYERMHWLAMAVRAQKWTFAASMPTKPHEWAIRGEWKGPGFNELITATRTMGHIVKFGRTDYNLLNLNEHRYWTMEVRYAPPEVSNLINRAVRLRYEPEPEPWLAATSAWWSEPVERFVLQQMMPDTRRVLDVGGTCHNVAIVAKTGYRAIGTPQDMARLLAEVPTARMMHVEVEFFAPTSTEPFDLTVAGFGTAAQLTRREVLRLRYMTKPSGCVVLQVPKKASVEYEVLVEEAHEFKAEVGTYRCWVVPGLWRPREGDTWPT